MILENWYLNRVVNGLPAKQIIKCSSQFGDYYEMLEGYLIPCKMCSKYKIKHMLNKRRKNNGVYCYFLTKKEVEIIFSQHFNT